MKKLFLLFLVLSSASLFAQAVGDYGSATSGNWGTAGTWVVCVTAGTWTGATAAPAQPDSTKNVWIRTGHNVTVDASGKFCHNLYIDNGGALSTFSSPYTSTTIRYVRVTGNYLVCNGLFGGDVDGCSIELGRSNRTLTISGTGTMKPCRIRPYSNVTGATCVIDMDITLQYSGSSPGGGGAAFYTANASNDNITLTVNAGKTVNVVAQGFVQTASSTSGDGIANTTFNIYGTINMNTGGNVGFGVASGKTCNVNIYNGGTWYVGSGASALASSAGTININVQNGGTLKVSSASNGTCDLSKATTTIDGTFDFGIANKTTRSIGTATINSGGKLRAQDNGWVTSGSVTFASGSTFELYGSTGFTLSASHPVTFSNLLMSNSGNITLANNTTVNGTLTLNGGNINTGSNTLTIGSSGSISRTSGHIIGALKKTSFTGAQTFEVGTANGYTPVNLTATGTGDFTVTTVGTPHPNAVGSNVLGMYWTLTNGGLTSADLVFNYLDGDVTGDEVFYVLGKYDGEWSFPTATVNTTANTASITGVTSFSDWTLGDNGALPVQLVTFKAYNEKGYVVLRWNTSTETQNYGWDIERRKTEKDKVTGWEKIGFVNGSMNSNSAKEYSYIDKNALYGQYEYRLRQNDLDGSVTYSDNVKITVGTKPVEYAVKNYPNPFNPSTIIRYEIPKSGYVNISVYNALGQKERTIVEGYVEEGIYQQTFEASGMSTGIYFYTLKTDGVTITKKMMFIK